MHRTGLLLALTLALPACGSKKSDGEAQEKAGSASKAFDPNQRLQNADDGLTDTEKKELEAAKRKMTAE